MKQYKRTHKILAVSTMMCVYYFDPISPLAFSAAWLIGALADVCVQVIYLLSMPKRAADDGGAANAWSRQKHVTLPSIRISAYGLYFLERFYRRSAQNQSLGNWVGPGSRLCQKLRYSLPRTSKSYICLRATMTMGLCSVSLYSVAKAQHAKPTNPAQFIQAVLNCWPVLLALFSVCHFTYDLFYSSKHFAKWIYLYERNVDCVQFRLQIDRWQQCEQSSSLGLDLGGVSISPDKGSGTLTIYAPLQTTSPGESLSMLLPPARREAKKQTALFVRCECCLDDQSATDLKEIQPIQAPRGIRFWIRGKCREQQALGGFIAQREDIRLQNHPEREAVPLSRPASPVGRSRVTSPKSHELCALCAALAF